MLWYAAGDTSVSDGNGIAINSPVILEVRRGDKGAKEISARDAYTQGSGYTSLYKASNLFPVFYRRSGRIYIKPDPSSIGSDTNKGTITYVKIPTTITASSTTWTIGPIEQPAITFAASLDSGALASYYSRKATSNIATIISGVSSKLSSFASALPTWSSPTYTLSTDITLLQGFSGWFSTGSSEPSLSVSTTAIDDALSKARYLIDASTQLTNGQDAEYWLNAEDPEMVVATINAAQEELGRAAREIEKQSLDINEYSAKIQKEVNKAQAFVNEYRAELEKEQIVNKSIVDAYVSYVQKESNRFQNELNKARSYIDAARVLISEADVIQNYNTKIQLYQGEALRLFDQSQKEMMTIKGVYGQPQPAQENRQ